MLISSQFLYQQFMLEPIQQILNGNTDNLTHPNITSVQFQKRSSWCIVVTQYEIKCEDQVEGSVELENKLILQRAIVDQSLKKLTKIDSQKFCEFSQNRDDLININIEKGETSFQQKSQRVMGYHEYRLIFAQTNNLSIYQLLQAQSKTFQDDQFKLCIQKVSKSFLSDWVRTLNKIFRSKTHQASKFRLIPPDIMHKIIEYSMPHHRYILKNHSNNYMVDMAEIGSQTVLLRQNFLYCLAESAECQYVVRVQRIFGPDQTKNLSICNHNNQAFKIINEYIQQVAWNLSQKPYKTILLNDLSIDELGYFSQEKINLIILKPTSIRCHEYHKQSILIVLRESARESISLNCLWGEKIKSNEMRRINGTIQHDNEKWRLRMENQGENERIWTKIKPNQKVEMDRCKGYLIRFSRFSSILQIQFKPTKNKDTVMSE